MIGVFLGTVLACLTGLILLAVAYKESLSLIWSEIMISSIANGMAGGFLAGVLRGPARAGKWLEQPLRPERRMPAAMLFCPQLGVIIGSVLASGARVILTLNTDLVTALARMPDETWAAMRIQGIGDLLGIIILGAVCGFFACAGIGAFLPSLNLTNDDTSDLIYDLSVKKREAKPMATSNDADLPPGIPIPVVNQANLPSKKMSEVKKPPDGSVETLREILKTAQAMANSKDYTGVLALLEPARGAYPQSADVAMSLADAYAELDRRPEAHKEFRRAIDIDPNIYLSHYNYGCFLRDISDVNDAISEFREAIALNPAYINAWLNLSDLVCEPQEAILCLEKAEQMGCREANLGQTQAMWHEIKEKQVDMFKQRIFWAQQALLAEDFGKARLHLAMAELCHPNSDPLSMITSMRAEILRQEGDIAGSVNLLRLATKASPEVTSYWNTLAAREVLLALEQMQANPEKGQIAGVEEESIKLFEEAVNHGLAAIGVGNYAKPNQNVALACLYLNRLDEARSYATTALKLAQKALAGRPECPGCPLQAKDERECRGCLQKAEDTLRDIELASGDYQVP